MNLFHKIEKLAKDFLITLFKYSVVPQTFNPQLIYHEQINDILIVVRHQMEDFLCASPMIRSIRNFYNDAKITLITKESTNYNLIFKHDASFVDDVFY